MNYGDDLTVSCGLTCGHDLFINNTLKKISGLGQPAGHITYSKQIERQIPAWPGLRTVIERNWTLHKVTGAHAGKWLCHGTNAYEKEINATFRVSVKGEPIDQKTEDTVDIAQLMNHVLCVNQLLNLRPIKTSICEMTVCFAGHTTCPVLVPHIHTHTHTHIHRYTHTHTHTHFFHCCMLLCT